jgi:prolyl-tRNA editing enzyme YbaK/EbsC (Cys-tRNA(Pro) deacylase)
MMMLAEDVSALPDAVQRVALALMAAEHTHTPIMLQKACRTSQEAADELKVSLGQIAKSVIFKGENEQAVLVVAAGDKRVDEKKLSALVGKLSRADADFVRSKTGFPIGGVSPLAHATPCITLLDASLKRFELLWAAAGHPNSVFCLSPVDLSRLTNAVYSDVT